MKKVELLSPAGSREAAIAAINAGADAIYIGGNLFGARAFAKNPGEEDLISIIEYAHIHGSRVYLTVNTLLKSDEINEMLFGYLKAYYDNGLDGVIVQDLGVFLYLKEHFPGLELHCSTQMTISDLAGALFLKNQGADRVVLSRELSLPEIREITKAGIETECFIHGALCYCYSGQCLMSSIFGGRSGNRGRCAQPCRLPYEINGKKKYILSPKDLCTIEFLPELIDAGIYSFKIEGRMKRAEYTAAVTSIYRKYIDLALTGGTYKVDPADMEVLLKAGNRSGFTSGYYKAHNGADMISVNKPDYDTGDEAFFKTIADRFVNTEKKEKITGRARLHKNEPAELEVSLSHAKVLMKGDLVSQAQNAPLDKERVEKQLKKTGDTPFEFDDLAIEMDGDIFIPMGALNALRREALSKLREEIISGSYPKEKALEGTSDSLDRAENNDEKAGLTVYIEKLDLLDTILAWDISRVYLDASAFASGNKGKDISFDLVKARDFAERIKASGKEAFLAMPHIFRKDIRTSFEGKT
ncbi:MAG: U32 family peptidase, partial [Lachnospiraceae bacterium]|nr:U32 family peptidase [Lachnospiraceae bacterium]